MKIIIKSSQEIKGRKVSVESETKVLTLDEALELVAAALKAYGFPQDAVDEAIPPR